jgi:sec-independent protein translocase protein TatC
MNDKRMPFVEHLEELRWVILKIILVLVIGAAIGWFIYPPAFELLMRPLSGIETEVVLITATPLDAFLVQLRMALLIGFVLTLPFCLWCIWGFISPGLNSQERRLGLWAVSAGTLFFLAGGVFAYQMLALVLTFLVRFNPENVQSMWHIREYMSFAFRLLLAFGVLFELPVVMVLAVRVGVVGTATLARIRPYAIVGVFLLAAILTPPDIFSQIMLALPLLLLYELGLLVARVVEKRGMVGGSGAGRT